MKRMLLTAAICSLFFLAEAQLRTPQASVGQTIKQDFALTSVEVNYSRPSARGRKIMGELVPYGKVWRTGANGATTISFKDDVTIDGKKVPAGTYGLLTIPNSGDWTIILSKQTDVTSPAAYKQDQDFLRFNVPAQNLPVSVETFMIIFDNAKNTGIDLMMIWENTLVAFTISQEVDAKVMAEIDQQMKSAKPPYFEAAVYYVENGKDLKKAEEWMGKAVKEDPNAFWVWYQQAKLQAKLGKKNEAIASAKKSIELAKAQKNDDYVTLNNNLLASLN